jgi:hypothetical protein
MLRRPIRLLLTVLSTLLVTALVVGLGAGTAEARGKGKSLKVSGVTRLGQDWYHGRLLVKWRPVSGASYQMRVAYAPSKMGYARVIPSGTAKGTYTGTLERGKTWYVQVRAVRSGAVGPWSRARGMKFLNSWPGTPSLTGSGTPGGVQFSWKYTPYASRYRVRWSPAWYGVWPGAANYIDRTSGGWVGQTARTSVFTVPTRPAQGDNMLAVDYANPVFAQVEANNALRSGASHRSKWALAFPVPPTPQAGDPVRFGTYNTMVFPTGARAAAVASNISSHGVTMAALQEADVKTANAVVASLGSNWRAVPSGSTAGVQQQILYRADKFTLRSSGKFDVPNPKSSAYPLQTPWARFTPVGTQYHTSQSFLVSSLHFAVADGTSKLEQNRQTGQAAQTVMRSLDSVNTGNEPVIVAGDLRYGREPYGDPTGYTAGQPTFVRGGYYDAMAALSRTGSQYSTVNTGNGKPSARQAADASGLGARSDHILFKGFRGSYGYTNVVNWATGGIIPSDHNLVYADIAIPWK